MNVHRLPASFLNQPIRVHVVGCGGSGSAIASGLPYLHQAIIARGHPYGLDVTLQDGDTISLTNCVRQPFSQGEIGHHKATVLATRINLFWGLRWKAIPRNLTAEDRNVDAHILIGCVDSAAARRTLRDYCVARFPRVIDYWLDLGNNADDGQFILGQPLPRVAEDTPTRLLTAPELFPAILEDAGGELLPSCSAQEALTRQAPFVNQVLANHALSLLARLFTGEITHHGGFVNLATGQARPLPIRERILPAQKGARARRRDKRPRVSV